MKEEIFGPVCHIAPFDSEEEAVAMANDTKYGLAASIWTSKSEAGTSRGATDESRDHVGELLVSCATCERRLAAWGFPASAAKAGCIR